MMCGGKGHGLSVQFGRRLADYANPAAGSFSWYTGRPEQHFSASREDRLWQPMAMLVVTFQSKFAASAIGAVEGQQSAELV